MKKTMCVSIDENIYHKIHVINTVKRFFFDDKDATISLMTEQAFIEYFKNHERELNELMDEYREEGGCFKL